MPSELVTYVAGIFYSSLGVLCIAYLSHYIFAGTNED